MNDSGEVAPQKAICQFCTFGVIVTGEGEREFVPSLFRSLMERAGCAFTVLRQIGQRNPITSEVKKLKMVGSNQKIPTKDESEIGLPARRFLRNQPCRFLILLDDVEDARRPILAEVFERYRTALDTMLQPDEQRRAAVHFFANMVEAYYFAHADAVNIALEADLLAADYADDVEEIGHPKAELKALFAGFDEKKHGAAIVDLLDIDHVLSTPETCAFLRSLVEWCVRQLSTHGTLYDADLPSYFQLPVGVRAELTASQ